MCVYFVCPTARI
jgi:hypothetical protein